MEFNFKNLFQRKKQDSEKDESESLNSTPKRELTEKEVNILLQAINDFQDKKSFVASEENIEMPAKAGRSSDPGIANTFGVNSMSPIQTDFKFELLPLLENMQVYNRHISYAIENIVSMGNTGFEIKFDSILDQSKQAKMKSHLENVMSGWYEFSDGMNGLISDLLTQVATFGCISAERIPRDDLKGIKKIVRVSPILIRYTYDPKSDEYIPLQELRGSYVLNNTGYVKLNKSTYSYIALKRFKNTPYAVSSFLSAIEDLLMESDMLASFKNMMKRIGVLGFLSVLVKAPRQDAGETDDMYRTRCENYLSKMVPVAESSFTKGVAVGFKDSHDFQVTGSDLNVSGAEGLMNIVKKLVYSGMKQDPSMHGENFSTTESFAKVILGKMSRQVEGYQLTVASFLEKCFIQELVLAGFRPGSIKVIFEKPSVSDKLNDAQTEKVKFETNKGKYEQGLIDQTQFAQAMGHSKPAEKEPRQISQAPSNSFSTIELLKKKVQCDLVECGCNIPEKCNSIDFMSISLGTDFKNSFMNEEVSSYIKEISNEFSDYASDSAKYLKNKIKGSDEYTSEQDWINAVLEATLINLGSNFIQKIQPIVEKKIDTLYSHFRKDKSIFTRRSKLSKTKDSIFDVPDSVFNAIDFRTIEYLKTIDGIWLGKFITDKDSIERITKWIKNLFEQGELPVGGNTTTTEFINEFEKILNLEQWKIRRIIETTANKSRAYASVNYIDQAGIDKYEIVEKIDSKTCDYCAHMNGHVLQTSIAVDHIKKVVNSDVNDINNVSPFATSVKIDRFKEMDSDQLQAAGFNTPPFHPHCRCVVVAYI